MARSIFQIRISDFPTSTVREWWSQGWLGSVWHSARLPFPWHRAACSGQKTRAYIGSNEDKFIPPNGEAVWPTSHTYTRTARGTRTWGKSAVSPWTKGLFFSGSASYPWLAHDRPSWLRLGVIMVRKKLNAGLSAYRTESTDIAVTSWAPLPRLGLIYEESTLILRCLNIYKRNHMCFTY